MFIENSTTDAKEWQKEEQEILASFTDSAPLRTNHAQNQFYTLYVKKKQQQQHEREKTAAAQEKREGRRGIWSETALLPQQEWGADGERHAPRSKSG